MPPHQCPVCYNVVFLPVGTIDYVCDCGRKSDNEAIKSEDVPSTASKWSDYTGSGVQGAPILLQGLANEVEFDLDAVARGYNVNYRTDRGNRSQTHRSRRRETYSVVVPSTRKVL